MTFASLLLLGFSSIWFGLKTKDEIHRMTAAILGCIFLVWGFALAPVQFQVLIETLMIIAVFSVCVRCTSS